MNALAGDRAVRAFVAILAGIALTLSLAPLDWWPLAIISLAGLLWVLQGQRLKHAFLLGWCYGLGLFFSGASWVYVSIQQYGNASVLLAGFLTIIWCSGLALLPALSALLLRTINPRSLSVDLWLFPALWVLGEWVRTWLLTGFPWLFAGYSQVNAPLASLAPIVGVFGISWVIALSASFLVCVLHLTRTIQIINGLLLALLWLGAAFSTPGVWTKQSEHTLSVGVVQANIDQNEKWDADKVPDHIALHEYMTEPLWGADLIVWPEAAIPRYMHQLGELIDSLEQQASKSNSVFTTGIPYQNAEGKKFNAIFSSTEPQLYLKRKLVPFGEFVPLDAWLRGLIDFFDLPMSRFSKGPANQSYLRVKGFRVAPLICYESVYPDLLVESDQGTPDLLLTISNDTWFGASFGPLQHLQMAQMRALELGRSMVRGTNNGVSALIDPYGKITARSGQFERQVLRGHLSIYTGETPFARFGSKPVLIFCALLMLLFALRRKT